MGDGIATRDGGELLGGIGRFGIEVAVPEEGVAGG